MILLRDNKQEVLVKLATDVVNICSAVVKGYSRHNAFHSNRAYNNIVSNLMFSAAAFDGRRLAIELVILREKMGE